MKIVKLVAENFKKLKAIEIIPQGNMIEITGKCEQGKTTVLDAIGTALCGTKWDEALREGADKGKIVVDLGDIIVTRTITKAGGTLKVETRDGAKYPSPQTLLDKLVGKIAFNPMEFSKEKDPKKQVDMLLKVVELKVDAAKLTDISGVVIEESPNPLDMLNAAYKSVYESRTAVNRDLDKAKKALESIPEVAEVEPVLLTELVAEKEKLEKVNRDNANRLAEYQDQERHLAALRSNKTATSEIISDLESRLIAAKKSLVEQENQISAQEQALKVAKAVIDSKQDEDLTDINERIAKADETNKQAQQYKDRQAKAAEVAKHQTESDDLSAKLKKIVDYKAEIIKNTKFPVPGLDFAGGGVTFEGKPFSQASSAQKIRVGMGVGMAANPELRVVMIDGYESLDPDQRKIVEEMATVNDFQVWTTSVSTDSTVGIYIEDGEIKASEAAG
ncbi:AAA family ATPase [Sporomusa sphaeroides]|uniref:Chromosome partition protein Smc n=1 Tax=Sporomusa sphaeroides DSM 2875 TaxID=1337886 RepID=A0ABP2C540_9FIRM|nr:AAA family ATPase [Sporomusa sphaeroides]OLS56404.1 hypothetical protein SPSPH_27970 [Sporomusa sphaeroides DSM 2875]CVK18499.1 hypothetical protein SSPH_01137 [Sporomusa sphaeroides DSM 2875]